MAFLGIEIGLFEFVSTLSDWSKFLFWFGVIALLAAIVLKFVRLTASAKKSTVFWGFYVALAVLGSFIIFGFLTKWMILAFGSIGDTSIALANINFDLGNNAISNSIENVVSWFLTSGGEIISWQLFLLGLVVFVMLGVAFSDILSQFSTFGNPNIMGWGLAFVAALTGVLKGVISWFGLTAGIGAVAMGLVMVNAFVLFIAINLLIGSRGMRAMLNAKDMKEMGKAAHDTAYAFASARSTAEAINRGNKEGARYKGP